MNPAVIGVVVGTVLTVLASGTWYGALGDRLVRLSPAYADTARPAATTLVVELVRSAVVAVGLAVLIAGQDVVVAVGVAVGLWVVFPVVLLAGSVFHERVPPMLAAIHAGDWLIKLVLIATAIGLLSY